MFGVQAPVEHAARKQRRRRGKPGGDRYGFFDAAGAV
jgi:chloramphenicol 3-O-phosphotransferase